MTYMYMLTSSGEKVVNFEPKRISIASASVYSHFKVHIYVDIYVDRVINNY